MTDAAWEALSNQAVAAAGVVYFLAMIAHLVEHAAARRVLEPAAAGGPGEDRGEGHGSVSVASGPEPDVRHRRDLFGRLGFLLTLIAAGVHLLALVARGLAADPNRVPWGNMYEFTLSGTFVVAAIYLLLHRRLALGWMAPIVVGVVLTLLMVGVIWLYAPIAPLTEALYSPWLVIHVVSAIIATGAFTLGGIASVLFLVKERRGERSERGYLARVPGTAELDRLSYRMHAFAFPVWTFAVLITGPIWAHQAWSTYWNWDPKEVWAFITWVVYAAYLHARATAGWRGRNAAILALVGLATLWFNFIGINFFSSTSQHSYAAPQSVSPGPASAAVVVEAPQEVGVVVGPERPARGL